MVSLNKQNIIDNWFELCRKFPLVCGLKTFNGELTIYEVLKQAYKQFDFVIITDDGSTDTTKEEIFRCINDFGIKNVALVDVSNTNPWNDDANKKRDGDHHIPRAGEKTHAKAQWKSYQLVKQNFQNSIFVSLEDDVILEENVRWRVYDRISKWTDPFTDCEFFNVTSTINDEYVLLGCFANGDPLPGIVQRRLYNNGGDWTFSAIWTGGDLEIGPDPLYPFGACVYPWLQKNQTGKKGQDGEKSFGFHMLNYRSSREGHSYSTLVPGVQKIVDMHEDKNEANWDLLKNAKFKKKITLEKVNDTLVQVIT